MPIVSQGVEDGFEDVIRQQTDGQNNLHRDSAAITENLKRYWFSLHTWKRVGLLITSTNCVVRVLVFF